MAFSSVLALILDSYLLISHESIKGSQYKSVSLTYTIPQRDTVAGDALSKFSTSKTSFTFSVIAILSLFARVRIRLSSSTVFRFSIQIASTGPSQVIHVLNFRLLELYLAQRAEKTPYVHSPDKSFITPYISIAVIALGFIRTILC